MCHITVYFAGGVYFGMAYKAVVCNRCSYFLGLELFWMQVVGGIVIN